jgi:hypothetical protein
MVFSLMMGLREHREAGLPHGKAERLTTIRVFRGEKVPGCLRADDRDAPEAPAKSPTPVRMDGRDKPGHDGQ